MIAVRNEAPPAEAMEGGVTKVMAVLQLDNEIGGHSDLALPKQHALALHSTLKELPILLAQKTAELEAQLKEQGETLEEGEHLTIDGAVSMPGFPPMMVRFCADHGLIMQMMITRGDDLPVPESSEDFLVSMMTVEVAFGVVEVDEVAGFLDELKVAADKAED